MWVCACTSMGGQKRRETQERKKERETVVQNILLVADTKILSSFMYRLLLTLPGACVLV